LFPAMKPERSHDEATQTKQAIAKLEGHLAALRAKLEKHTAT